MEASPEFLCQCIIREKMTAFAFQLTHVRHIYYEFNPFKRERKKKEGTLKTINFRFK